MSSLGRPKLVTIKQGDFYYRVPMHEFSRYWLPYLGHIDVPDYDELVAGEYVHLKRVPPDVPIVSRKAGLKRGKSFKRELKAMNTKGSGKHAITYYRD